MGSLRLKHALEGIGWNIALNAQKAHFYRTGGKSACGRYVLTWAPLHTFDPWDSKPSPSDCATCRKWVDKAIEEKKAGEGEPSDDGL